MTPRLATTGVFLVNGAVVGTWVAQIPALQARLEVSRATLGQEILCLCESLGVIVDVVHVEHGSEPIVFLADEEENGDELHSQRLETLEARGLTAALNLQP